MQSLLKGCCLAKVTCTGLPLRGRPYGEKELLVPFYLLGTALLKGSQKKTSVRRHGSSALAMTVLAKE